MTRDSLLVRLSKILAWLALCLPLTACRPPASNPLPSIEFLKVPPADMGGPDKFGTIEGRAIGARPGQQIVLFAKSNQWWVQPNSKEPFTAIARDSRFSNSIHLGVEYAALLVEPAYHPPSTIDALPATGGAVVAVATIKGEGDLLLSPKTISFSGYEWEVRQLPSPRGGVSNPYHPSNAWTDAKGRLHLRITKAADKWACAEVMLRRSLGYGSYHFVVQEDSRLEPAAVLGFYTWDELNAEQNHREMDIEISRWGDPGSKNAQYTIQPYYVPVNMYRFLTTKGVLTHSFQWEPGRVLFRSVSGDEMGPSSRVLAEHVFSSGVPSPGAETVRMSFYVYGKSRTEMRQEAEVVIEKFSYFP
jgi:hypothetical protein